jgi:SAM-dependent methyltransferase
MSEYVYDEDNAKRYDLAVPLQPGEVDFYLELARDAEAHGLRSLEVTCGTGRIAVPLAEAGVRIVGLDISAPMLAVARTRSASLSNAQWVEGDMRSFDLGEEFGLVYIPVGSFQLMYTVEDQLASLRCIHKHLAPGGRFAFEVENPNLVIMGEWLTTRRGVYYRNSGRDYTNPDTGRRVLPWGTVEYHPSEQRYVSLGIDEEVDADGVVVRKTYGRPLELRYFHRYEMEHLLARCGFEVEALYGDLEKHEYRSTSPDFIWVARKRVDSG